MVEKDNDILMNDENELILKLKKDVETATEMIQSYKKQLDYEKERSFKLANKLYNIRMLNNEDNEEVEIRNEMNKKVNSIETIYDNRNDITNISFLSTYTSSPSPYPSPPLPVYSSSSPSCMMTTTTNTTNTYNTNTTSTLKRSRAGSTNKKIPEDINI